MFYVFFFSKLEYTNYQLLKHITITLTKEENKTYRQSPCTPINEFFSSLFCESWPSCIGVKIFKPHIIHIHTLHIYISYIF